MFSDVEAAIKRFETSFLNWLGSEEVVVETIGTELVAAVEAILVTLKPTVVADIRAILQALPQEFLSGAGFADIMEEVYNQGKDDLKKIIEGTQPHVLEALIGVLVNGLVKL